MGGRLIVSTYPDGKSVEEAARLVVTGGLAACVSIVKVKSIYRWKGALEEVEEYLALFKTVEEKVEGLKAAVEARHPYEVPEVVELAMTAVNRRYLEWMVESVGEPRSHSESEQGHNTA